MKPVALLLLSLFSITSAFAKAESLHPDQIEKLTGLKGKMNEKEGVFTVSFPRKDLKITAQGIKMIPPMGLTAWTAFTRMKGHVMAMGDLVLTQDQVNAVMSVALENGLEVTALHNHFFYDSPKVMFMHIGGMGEEEKIATAVGKVFTKLKETAQNPTTIANLNIDPTKNSITTKKIDEIFGVPGEVNSGVYKVTIGKTTTMEGQEIGKAMGVNTWAAFTGTDEKALVDGDFAMKEDELQNVLKTLRRAEISVVAIHQHMTHENPRIIFLHYWGVGRASELAKALKSALDTQAN
jgi:hypothetical protein